MAHSTTEASKKASQKASTEVLDALVVGAGFAGMYMVHKLRTQGRSVVGIEEGSDVGGTWYWNRYPGARCDVESMEYSYEFSDALQQEWNWSERFAPQSEILSYANHVADRFDLRKHIRFNTRVVSAKWNNRDKLWSLKVRAAAGALDQSTQVFRARFCIMATGCLSSTNLPDVSGLDSFAGNTYHTGRWPKEGVDFTGRRVAIVGTGSSAIQSIPLIAEQAASLTVFQRTATYSVPARNGPLDKAEADSIKANYAEFRAANKKVPAAFGAKFDRGITSALKATPAELNADLERRWEIGGFGFLGGFGDFMQKPEANALAAEFVRNKIRGMVQNSKTAALLCPEQLIGCKRLCFDSGYYETYNRNNVHLVSVKDKPIEKVTPLGLRTGGVEYVVDDLVFATGFDAMTGALLNIDIRGKGGQTLRDKWSAGPRTYLGLMTQGFPNLFTITGPGSPSVLANMVVATQQHVDWIGDCLDQLDGSNKRCIEASLEAEDNWVLHVNAAVGNTLYPTCNSWYLGANVPGKPRVFMPYLGFPSYVQRCEEVVADGYRGFDIS